MGTGDVPDYGTVTAASMSNNGRVARIDNSQWLFSGHGKVSGNYDKTGHAAANFGGTRLIYCLAAYAIVVASDVESGGTRAGATETLKNGWVPVFVLEHEQMPDGNKILLQKGALAFPHPF